MQTSKDPMRPLRCWKELILGERNPRLRKQVSLRRRCTSSLPQVEPARVPAVA